MSRPWESIISYEDRAGLTTSRWRLTGVRTRQGAENTDAGVLWLKTTRTAGTLAAELYKCDGLAAGDKVAEGSADVSGTDGAAENAAPLTLSEANDSGLSGSLRVHACAGQQVCPVQVALCTDEDLSALWDGVAQLSGYDATAGMAEFIRLAGEDVLARVARTFRDQLGGAGAAEAWFIADAARSVPDLRRIANPGQLRLACACRALQMALGRQHSRGEDTAYSMLRDTFGLEYDAAMASLNLALRGAAGSSLQRRLARA